MFEFHLPKEFRNRKIIFSSEDNLEPQEVFLDNLAKRKESEFGLPEIKFEVPISQGKIKIFLALISILFLSILGRVFQLQVLNYDGYTALAQKNKFIFDSIGSDRGVIYDSNGEQLVFNKPSFDLMINKKRLPESGEELGKVLGEAAQLTGQTADEISKKIEKEKSNQVLVSEIVDHKKLVILETKIGDLTGFEIQKNSVREYKDGKTFSHVVGYTSKVSPGDLESNPGVYSGFDYIGKTGLEKSYEEYLRRNPGKVQVERDVYGNEISKKIITPAGSGKSLVLYLNAGLQRKAEEELKKTLERVGSTRGVVVAMDPKTGGVLAMVNIPNFDNNLFITGADATALDALFKDKEQPLFNRAISGDYVTGSTIKPLSASAALQEKIINPAKKINCTGKITIKNQYDPSIIYEREDLHIHGATDMRKAIAESCNVYFFTIGGGYENQAGLGPSRLKKYLELFGWGSKTGIDIPSESAGFIPDKEWKKAVKKEGWWDGDTYNLAIGQGDLKVTPLQVATSYSAIANNGTVFKPQLVRQVVDSEKNVIEEIKPVAQRSSIINPDYLQVAREGMREAVTGEGAPQASCLTLGDLPVSAAAKTGTAQTSIDDTFLNWVTVFAPYEDPQIVITVLVENVKGIQAAALPVAKETLRWYFTEGK